MKKFTLFLLFSLQFIGVFAQITVSGRVLDEHGNALVGANVSVKASSIGAVSGADGSYALSLAAGKHTLLCSFVGYQTQNVEVTIEKPQVVDFRLQASAVMFEDVIVAVSRADARTPIAHSNIDREAIASRNDGKDLPVLVGLSPSVVTTTDAGTGVGYTDLRVRGSNISRINVTVNGVPLNDPESHGVFWVNMPDFAGTTENIQIQRGVGTSSNGAAAFGASIDLQTVSATAEPYAEVGSSYGSFNTNKTSIRVGTGLLTSKFAFNLRLSQITSDGFIDRASSDLKSYYFSAGYFGTRTSLKFVATTGKEQTYQAWNGVPKFKLLGDQAAIEAYIADNWLDDADAANLRNASPRTYNGYTYDNETDNYEQSQYQLILSQQLTSSLKFNATLFYTKGAGYYEQYKKDKKLADYGLPNVVVGSTEIKRTDLIQRKWLDNDFYGFNYHFDYEKNAFSLRLGQSLNRYDGDHFGQIIWARYASTSNIRHEWYRGNGLKTDFSSFAILRYSIGNQLHAFADLQYRQIGYTITGDDDDAKALNYKLDYQFFNPKAGLVYQPSEAQSFYASYSRAHREPNRANIVDTNPGEKIPVAETLDDFEVGYKMQGEIFSAEANLFYMNYHNQLVLTGNINDVGTAIMENVDKSYRAGVELSASWRPVAQVRWAANLALSQNRILDFVEKIPTYSEYWETYLGTTASAARTTQIAFSPSTVASSQINYEIIKGLSVNLETKYVSRQYIDNTETKYNSLDPYWVNDLGIGYDFRALWFKKISLRATAYNLLNEEYETNAWIAKYIIGTAPVVYDGYFPQAGRHFMFSANFSF